MRKGVTILGSTEESFLFGSKLLYKYRFSWRWRVTVFSVEFTISEFYALTLLFLPIDLRKVKQQIEDERAGSSAGGNLKST
jgi:hypothetical protein